MGAGAGSGDVDVRGAGRLMQVSAADVEAPYSRSCHRDPERRRKLSETEVGAA